MPQSLLEQLAAEIAAQGGRRSALPFTTKDVPSSTPTTTYGHGDGGLFSYPGLERDIVNAMIMPRMGLVELLPSRTSNYTDPLHGIFTGVTATTGEEPDGVCDDPPTAGLAKLCTHTFPFGRFSRMTRVFDIDRVGVLTNRGEFDDFNMVGGPQLAQPQTPDWPGGGGMNDALRSEIGKQRLEFAVAWARDIAGQTYTGNPTNNTANEGYKEPYGLDVLINTGYRDAVTGQACPAADSYVVDFNNQTVADNSNDLLLQITYMVRNVQYIADRAGLTPTQHALAMTWAAFYEITEIWPCSYQTYRCAGNFSESDQRVTDSFRLNEMRDAMREGQYLLVDGRRVPVVLDDGIAETMPVAGVFESDIYYVPLRVLGNRPATYLEYLDYDAPNGAMDAARQMAPEGHYFTTNGGRYLWHRKPPNNFCVQALAKTEWRLVLETPHIAGRITNVRYAPVEHQRDPFTDGQHFVDGGRTDYIGYGPSFYSPTA